MGGIFIYKLVLNNDEFIIDSYDAFKTLLNRGIINQNTVLLDVENGIYTRIVDIPEFNSTFIGCNNSNDVFNTTANKSSTYIVPFHLKSNYIFVSIILVLIGLAFFFINHVLSYISFEIPNAILKFIIYAFSYLLLVSIAWILVWIATKPNPKTYGFLILSVSFFILALIVNSILFIFYYSDTLANTTKRNLAITKLSSLERDASNEAKPSISKITDNSCGTYTDIINLRIDMLNELYKCTTDYNDQFVSFLDKTKYASDYKSTTSIEQINKNLTDYTSNTSKLYTDYQKKVKDIYISDLKFKKTITDIFETDVKNSSLSYNSILTVDSQIISKKKEQFSFADKLISSNKAYISGNDIFIYPANDLSTYNANINEQNELINKKLPEAITSAKEIRTTSYNSIVSKLKDLK